jgi:predicted transcriptional regulator
MADSSSSLPEILAELHEALEASGEELADDVRAELRETAEEIRKALDPEETTEFSVSLRDRLSRSLESFEESHPRLTQVVGRVADALSDMGI